MTYAATSMRRRGLGQTGATAAGEINGIATLLADIQATSAGASQWLSPGFSFNKSRFDQLVAMFRLRAGETNDQAAQRIAASQATLSGADVQQLIAGCIGMIGNVIVSAKMLAQLTVTSDAERAANQSVQSSMIDPARLLWSSLDEAINNMQARQQAAHGLGNPLAIAAIIVLAAAVYIIIGLAAITALTYLADSYIRSSQAMAAAQQICQQSQNGCTPEQRANLQRQLALGPFDQAITNIGKDLGTTGSVVLAVGVGVGVLGALGLGYYVWRKVRS